MINVELRNDEESNNSIDTVVQMQQGASGLLQYMQSITAPLQDLVRENKYSFIVPRQSTLELRN